MAIVVNSTEMCNTVISYFCKILQNISCRVKILLKFKSFGIATKDMASAGYN